MLHRGGEQRGADELEVITAKDEKERKETMRDGGWRRSGGEMWKSNG